MAKKRANGEGSLRRKENGHWEVQIMVGYRPDGSRDIRSFSAPTQKEAKAKMHAFLKKREAGLLKGEESFNADEVRLLMEKLPEDKVEYCHRYTQILRQLSDDSCAGDGAVLRPASAGYG